MGHPRGVKAAITEDKVKQKLQTIEEDTYKTAYDVKTVKLQLQTPQQSPDEDEQITRRAREVQQILSIAEQRALAKWITQFTRSGHPECQSIPHHIIGGCHIIGILAEKLKQ
jgi:hypothetical protein